MVQGDLRQGGNRASVKIVVGDAHTMTAQKARTIARGYLSEIGQGRSQWRDADAARDIQSRLAQEQASSVRDNPVVAVDWNAEERRNTAMGVKDLPDWFNELAAIENPIRREFHLFTLLSGSRPTALKTANPEHFDLKRRVLHIPTPKGGSKRAIDIPLSRHIILCLVRTIRYSRLMHPM